MEAEALSEDNQNRVLSTVSKQHGTAHCKIITKWDWFSDGARNLAKDGYAPHRVISLLRTAPPEIDLVDAKHADVNLTQGPFGDVCRNVVDGPEASAPGRRSRL